MQVSTIEFSLVEVSVLHGLKQGTEVLKEIHKELNVESVERLLEETAEAREYQRVCSSCPMPVIPFSEGHWYLSQEIDNMLTNSLSLDEEDAVQAELKSLQQEAVSSSAYVKWERLDHLSHHFNQLLAQETTKIPLSLPDVPTTEPMPSEEGESLLIR